MVCRATGIDPVGGLVEYVQEIKPYHTKILEVLVEYISTDCIDVTFTEDFELSLGVPADPSKWGWTEEEANRMFNDNWTNYQINDSGSNYWIIDGDFVADFEPGTEFLVKTDGGFTEYESSFAFKITDTVNGVSVDTTRIDVTTVVPANTNGGAIFHRSAYSYDKNTGVYSLKAGLVFPSAIGVEKNSNCGGFGSSFEYVIEAASKTPNAILSSSSTLNSFDIDNTLTTPITGANSWADILKYGVKVHINGTNNDGEYTVFLSIPDGGSPDILRVYVLESVAFSESAGGTLKVEEWGYDEPDVCVDQGQSLEAASNISERLEFVVNEVDYNMVQGWDMAHWDLGGFDGGPATIIATLT